MHRASCGVRLSALRRLLATPPASRPSRSSWLGIDSPESADPLLERYFESLYLAGEGKSVARWTLYGLAWHHGWPTRGPTFPFAKQSLKGWDQKEPSGSRLPAAWEAVLAVAFDLMSSGDRLSALCGALLPLAFDAYLRPFRGSRFDRRGSGSTAALW